MRFNIQSKIFVTLVGLTALILTGVLIIITRTVSEKLEEKIIEDFNRTQTFFLRQQQLIYQRLVESCYLIAENSTFKANVSLQDPASVIFSIQEFADFATVDLFIVTDPQAIVMGRLHQPDKFGDNLAERPSIMRALNGIEPEFEPEWAELWNIDGALFQIVSLPIYTGQATLLGSITLGSQITEFEANTLKGNSNIEISFFLNGELFASTAEESANPDPADSVTGFYTAHETIFAAVRQTMSASDAFSAKFNDEDVFAFISPLGEGESAYYLATIPKSLELRVVHALQKNIYLTGGISFVITLILALFLGRTLSRPILQLVKGMNEVKGGNLDMQIKPTTKDEIGLLTQTFNDMIAGLRERFHLAKYVGSHTLEMIKKSSQKDVVLGGDRRDLVVLFSDIRGFTSFSENRDPEEVIAMLNRYLGYQAQLVDQYNGSVDKFVGDEMVALFGGENALMNALDCAIAIQKMIRAEHERDPHPIFIGIGINRGSMILGNMGATERMDYTVIGAPVNLGARLCSAAKPGQILVRRELLNGLGKEYHLGEIHNMEFKGFSEQIEVVEVRSD